MSFTRFIDDNLVRKLSFCIVVSVLEKKLKDEFK